MASTQMADNGGQPDVDWTAETFKKKRVKLQSTKKKGCTATMHIKKVEVFPDFEIAVQGCTKNRITMLKSAALTNLSQQLNGDNPPRSEMRLYVTITKMSCHTEHDFGNFMKYGQTVDHSIIERINDLVQEGITSVHEVKTCLRYYVQDVLFNGKEKPDLDCRAFYPTSKDIRNHIQESLRQGRCSNLDQENVAMLVSALEREEPTSKVLFRPYCYTSEAKTTIPEADDDQINVEETLAKQCDRTLLFCYQSRFMAELLKQYGNNVTCLDATNKTTDYSLPLFFLVVKTPTNYMVAGVFVVQYETSACISEALSVFKSWDPEYLPKYFMVDFCQAEISAISEVFPQSEVMLCNFHREQAWERWVKKKENDVPPDQKDALLGLFRKIANSSSREEFDEAYKCLKNSVFWRNDKVASYFETQWMPAAKMWVQYHRMKFGVVVTTNNGTETQNRILKEHYLSCNKWNVLGECTYGRDAQAREEFLAALAVVFEPVKSVVIGVTSRQRVWSVLCNE
ncbi:uncharacterized protein LOC142817628 [Rhipicephalus microplus]|uniref:uncharacterized protein LOC142817628 n=1 Tax=Rhipicephalus microplus TaxID=6941 RepID=UPI003F6BDD77